MSRLIQAQVKQTLQSGLVIPACPLALNAQRQFDERRQRALLRYYFAAGAGGLAVAVHTTQFSIRDPKVGLFRPVLELAAEELRAWQPREMRESQSQSQSEIRNPKSEIPKRVSGNVPSPSIPAARSSSIREMDSAMDSAM